MSKITLNNVGNLIDATTAATTINNNSAVIVSAMDNTLSRNGSAPNQMGSSLDMNSNSIINLPSLNLIASSPSSPSNGELWFDGTNLKIRIGSTTKTIMVS